MITADRVFIFLTGHEVDPGQEFIETRALKAGKVNVYSLLTDKVAENPFGRQRGAFHILCLPT
ncbi:MAG TPA: hypothetical protein VIN35_03795 [Hydrogenophaga sp.]